MDIFHSCFTYNNTISQKEIDGQFNPLSATVALWQPVVLCFNITQRGLS